MASNARVTEYDFVQKHSEDYFCPVTLEILKDPRQTNSCCGHHLSRGVAERLEKAGKPCPLCKKSPLKTAEDLFFKRKVLELEVRCSNKAQGCKWVGGLQKLDNHLMMGSVKGQCMFVCVECPLECNKHMQRFALEKHKSSECVKRPYSCKYCSHKDTYEIITKDHWPKCQKYPEKCPNRCSEVEIERRFLKSHLEDCPLQEVECEFSYAGCTTKTERRKMKEHMDSNTKQHLDTLASFTKSLHKEVHTLQSQYHLLSLTISDLQSETIPTCIPLPEFHMGDFERMKRDNKSWYSSPFYSHIGGYKMCMRVDADSSGDGKGTHTGVFVCIMKGEFDEHLKWPFKGEIIIQLVNQSAGGKNLEMLVDKNSDTLDDYDTYFVRVTNMDRRDHGWGVSKYISHTDLYKDEQYLKNDTLKLRVIKVVVL